MAFLLTASNVYTVNNKKKIVAHSCIFCKFYLFVIKIK